MADFARRGPAHQYQVVCRVELWYRLRVKVSSSSFIIFTLFTEQIQLNIT